MSEYNVRNRKTAKAQRIRKMDLRRKENKMEELKLLDSKVKTPGKIVAGILGISGVLLMGAGMLNIMVWNVKKSGLATGILGLVFALLAYPVYRLITASRKKKYNDQILKEVINEVIKLSYRK